MESVYKDIYEGSATLKSKVFGAKKAKEKQENVTGFSEERKRKSKKADMGIAIEKLAGISEKEKEKSKKGKKLKKRGKSYGKE